MKIQLHGKLQEQKINYVSAPGPQLQLGRPPTAGRQMAAILIHPNQILPQLLHQVQLIQILGNRRGLKRQENCPANRVGPPGA